MFYSKSTGGFFSNEIHGDNIPGDAVMVTDDDYTALLEAQSIGKIIQADKDGKPIAVDPPKLTTSEIVESIKTERDRRTEKGGYKVSVDGIDKWFHSDQKSRSQQQDNEAEGANLIPVQWKTMDGSFVIMTAELAAQIRVARMVSDRAIFAVAEAHRIAMEESADPAAYDFSTGWPATFIG